MDMSCGGGDAIVEGADVVVVMPGTIEVEVVVAVLEDQLVGTVVKEEDV